MCATTISTLKKQVNTDSTTNQDFDDEDLALMEVEDLTIIEDEVDSVTTEATSMVIKTEITTTPIPTFTQLKSKNPSTKNI